MFRRLLDAFPSASVVTIAALLPVITSSKMLIAPLTTMLCERTGYRVVCAGGGLCFAIGIILASQAPSLELFYVSIIVSGLGVGFIYCPSLCLLLKYFDRRRSLANGFGMTGPYFLIPILMELLMEHYGFRGGLLIYGGICLHVFLTGFVMKDIKIIDGLSQDALSQDVQEENKLHSLLRVLKQPSLVIICSTMLLHFLGIWPIYLVFPQFVSSAMSSPRSTADFTSAFLNGAWLLTATAASEMVARPLVGFVLDVKTVRPRLKWVIVFSLLLTSAVTFALTALPFLHQSFFGWLFFAIVFGFFNSLLTTHGLVLIADSFSAKEMPNAASVFQFSKGIGGCIGPVVAGFILETTESFAACFYFAASATLVAGFTLAFYAVEMRQIWRQRNREEQEETTS